MVKPGFSHFHMEKWHITISTIIPPLPKYKLSCGCGVDGGGCCSGGGGCGVCGGGGRGGGCGGCSVDSGDGFCRGGSRDGCSCDKYLSLSFESKCLACCLCLPSISCR